MYDMPHYESLLLTSMFDIRRQVQPSLAVPRERQANRSTFDAWVLDGQNQERNFRLQIVRLIRARIVDGNVQNKVVAAINGVCLE